MVNIGINGVILRVKNNNLGDTWNLPVLGRTLEEWVAGTLNVPCHAIEASTVINIADKIKPLLDRTKPITVVLYCDTPLVVAKTIETAVKHLTAQNLNSVKLPRGCVYKTDYLYATDTLFPQEPTGSGEFEAVTDCESLSRITDTLRRRILNFHAGNGVLITDYKNVYIDSDVVIERGAAIEPYNFIKGKTVIKADAHIMPNNYIENCIIGSGARVDSSRLYASIVGEGSRVGPFAYIRPNTVIGKDCRIGDFVELKSCVIGDGCKVSHLTYIGDAELGAECNVGCGVVFANYDGKNKYKSIVGNRVFIGSNSNIIAPVHIADHAFIAAGSTITDEVPAEALAIARSRQTNIPHWAGNMYAPPAGSDNPSPYRLIQDDEGIIDGAASETENTSEVDKNADTDGNGDNNGDNNGEQPE
ncbi:MAG: hypothetical protein K2L88_00465 [Clostridiales bacterium]|nr:hypothetical protein [Clostridiales bacterium]